MFTRRVSVRLTCSMLIGEYVQSAGKLLPSWDKRFSSAECLSCFSAIEGEANFLDNRITTRAQQLPPAIGHCWWNIVACTHDRKEYNYLTERTISLQSFSLSFSHTHTHPLPCLPFLFSPPLFRPLFLSRSADIPQGLTCGCVAIEGEANFLHNRIINYDNFKGLDKITLF